MPLPEHLHPTTYWEKRCELLEEAVTQLMQRLVPLLPPAAHGSLQELASQWSQLLVELGDKHPAPPKDSQ